MNKPPIPADSPNHAARSKQSDGPALLIGALCSFLFLAVWVATAYFTGIRFDIATWASGLAGGTGAMMCSVSLSYRRGLKLAVIATLIALAASLTFGLIIDPAEQERRTFQTSIERDPDQLALLWMAYRFGVDGADPELSAIANDFYLVVVGEHHQGLRMDLSLTDQQRRELDRQIAEQITQWPAERRQGLARIIATEAHPDRPQAQRISDRFTRRNIIWLVLGFLTALYFGAQPGRTSPPPNIPAPNSADQA